LPWVYIRRKIAKRWNCTPWEVDDSPIGEIETELTLSKIEEECRPKT